MDTDELLHLSLFDILEPQVVWLTIATLPERSERWACTAMAIVVLFDECTVCWLLCFEVFLGTKFIKIFSLLFSWEKAGEGGRGAPSCYTVSMKLLPQMLSWLLVTVSEMAAAFCKSSLKIDLFGYACSLKGTLSVRFSPNILAWLLSAMPSLLNCQPIWTALQWARYCFTYRQICFEHSAIKFY